MIRQITYNTKQHEAVLNYIISLEGAHVTAAQIEDHFKKMDIAIGRTTIYRHLGKLTESGKIRKYTTDSMSGSCYQFVNNKDACHTHIHLKCDECGELLHLECNKLDEIQQHFSDKHGFIVNASKTVLYGKCCGCR